MDMYTYIIYVRIYVFKYICHIYYILGFLSTPQRVLHDKDANSTFRKSPICFPTKMRTNETQKKCYFLRVPPPKKTTWQWKIYCLKMEFLLKIGIIQCHVSFQGTFRELFVNFSELNPRILAKLYVAEFNSSTHQRHNTWIFRRELGILEATIHNPQRAWWKL